MYSSDTIVTTQALKTDVQSLGGPLMQNMNGQKFDKA